MYMGYWDNLLFYTRYSTILFQPCRRFSPSPSERITGRIVHFSKLSSRLIVLSGDFCFAGTKKMFVRRYLLYLVSATLPRYETLPESRNKNKKTDASCILCDDCFTVFLKPFLELWFAPNWNKLKPCVSSELRCLSERLDAMLENTTR